MISSSSASSSRGCSPSGGSSISAWSKTSVSPPGAAGWHPLRPGRRGSRRRVHAPRSRPAPSSAPSSSASRRPSGGHHRREVLDEALERVAVGAQRGDRDPLLGAVVAVADRDRTRLRARRHRGTRPRPTLRRARRSSPARGGGARRRGRGPSTKGESSSTTAGGRLNVAITLVSGSPCTWARISSGSCSGRNLTSTSITQVSGTRFSASPPTIRPRLIEGRSKSRELCRANGSDSMPRKTSTAFTIALSPSHGVAPCAERPPIARRMASTPLACTPTWRLVGSPVIAKSPTKPSLTSASDPRSASSSDSSSETMPRRSRTASCSRASRSTSIITASAPFMS